MDCPISRTAEAETETHPALVRALDMLLDVVCVVDAEGRFVAVSAACEQVFGYTQAELIGKPFLDLVLPEDRPRTIEAAAGVMAGIPLHNFENRYIRKDGQVVDIMWSARWSETDQLRLAVAREVTARKRQEAMQAVLYAISEAAHSAEDLDELFRSIHQIIGDLLPTRNFAVVLYDPINETLSFPYVVDQHGTMPAACAVDADELIAEVIRNGEALLVQPASRKHRLHLTNEHPLVDWLGVPLISNQVTVGALVVRSYDPAVRYNDQHKTLLHFVSNQIAANIQRKQANARLQYMAQFDVLTGLPNRMLFDDRLLVALAKASRTKSGLALLYIDLDNFKPVNDRFGHAAGDLLLQELASRIQACLRESDTVCRIGGDEFVILVDGLQAPESALAVAEHIRVAIEQPYALPRHSLQISASIGVAVHPMHGSDPNQLMRHADIAMYRAKHAGGNACQLYAETLQSQP